mmetsp:Transcript_6026/g.18048  ORF Transcript_6026/g.18048 Transcript_6026/m.18048 type:complete len:541 (+) Transcript_6026:57-1679(+)
MRLWGTCRSGAVSCSAGTSYPHMVRSLGTDRASRSVPVTTGEIPRQLRRSYFMRNGPDVRHDPLFPDETHWFDGDGLVHWVRLGGPECEYGANYVESQGFLEEEREGKAKYCGIRQSPIRDLVLWGLFSKLVNTLRIPSFLSGARGNQGGADRPYWVIQQKNTGNNGIMSTGGGKLLATYEAGSPYELKFTEEGGKSKLETVGLYVPRGSGPAKYDPLLHNFTAHSKTCPETKECFFISYDLIGRKFHIGCLDCQDELQHMRTFDYAGGGPCMLHDFAITERYVIIMNHPLVFNLRQSMQGGLPFTYDKDTPSFFGVYDRRGEGEIRWIEAENCYCYHSMAAFEDPDDPDVVHLYAHRLSETTALGMATFKENGVFAEHEPSETAFLHKWRIETGAEGGRVLESRKLCDFPCDFPAVNPDFLGKEVQFGYSLRISTTADAGTGIPLFDALVKHDLRSGEKEILPMEDGWVADDMTFVPDEARQGQEDGGFLLFFSHSLDGLASTLMVVDAADITAGPVATVDLPPIPLGFHAHFHPRKRN